MTWAKIDDGFHAHPKARKAWRSHQASLGLHLLAISYCGDQLTDGAVDAAFVEEKVPVKREREAIVAALVTSGLWTVATDGWLINDWLEYNPSRADVERNRAWDKQRKALHRDPDLVAALRDRDQDRCRYCGVKVNWKDRRGDAGGTYDHVIPRGANTLENVVVACRKCNLTKGPRTPDQAAMPLLETGATGQIGASSDLARESDRFCTPDPTRPVELHTDGSRTMERGAGAKPRTLRGLGVAS